MYKNGKVNIHRIPVNAIVVNKKSKKIYDLDVAVIPTNMPMVRHDFPDAIYKTRPEKFEAVLDEIE